jgi:S1-C subfamily serine protease
MNRPLSAFRLPPFLLLLATYCLLPAACCLLPAAYSPAQCPGGNCPLTLAPSSLHSVSPSSSFRQPAPAHVAPPANGPAPVWRYAEAQGHYRSVVRIEGHVGVAGKKLGSGVCVRWGDRKVILTAGHMARGCKEVRVYLPAAKRWVTARVVKIDDAWDVAILVLPESDAAELVVADIAWGDEATPERGARLQSCGFGPDGWLAINSGTCLDYRGNGASGRQADWLELSGRARQGDSGGPVFDAKNQVVGILWGTDDRTVTATQAGYLHQVLAQSLGPWQQSGERKAESGLGLVAAEETCDGKLLARLRGKTKAPATPAPPQVIVNPDPEVHAGLKQIEGTLGQVAQNTAPKPEPAAPAGVPEWAKILCIVAAFAVGGFVFYVVQQN